MELTSPNRPLRIAEVPVPGGGLLGLTLCPGKRQASASRPASASSSTAGPDLAAPVWWQRGF